MLSAAKHLAALSMTGLDLSVDAELSSAFEPYLKKESKQTMKGRRRKNRCLKRHKVQHHRKRYPSRYTPIISSLLRIVDLLNTIWTRTKHCDTAGVKEVW